MAPGDPTDRRRRADGPLGTWNTTLVNDGLYELRLTVNVSQGTAVTSIVSPLRIENVPSPFAATAYAAPTATLFIPTETPVPTQDSTPRITISSSPSGNVRQGDSVFYGIIMSLPTGTSARILGISNRGTGWYQIQLDSGQIGWVSPTIVTTSGDLFSLPRIEPPPPPPPTATPVPSAVPTSVAPVSNANLVAGNVSLDPGTPTCNQTFTVHFDVANLGSEPTAISGMVSLVDTRTADGSQQGNTIGGFPVLQAGAQFTFNVSMPLTISTWYNEQHTITLVIDPSNQIPETNESDNVRTITYTLQKGSCP